MTLGEIFGAFLAIFANPVTIKIALQLIENWAESKSLSAQQRKVFLDLAKTLSELGVKGARSIFESEDRQNAEINQKWNDEKQKESKTKEEKSEAPHQ